MTAGAVSAPAAFPASVTILSATTTNFVPTAFTTSTDHREGNVGSGASPSTCHEAVSTQQRLDHRDKVSTPSNPGSEPASFSWKIK
jgi:hypothetical protein